MGFASALSILRAVAILTSCQCFARRSKLYLNAANRIWRNDKAEIRPSATICAKGPKRRYLKPSTIALSLPLDDVGRAGWLRWRRFLDLRNVGLVVILQGEDMHGPRFFRVGFCQSHPGRNFGLLQIVLSGRHDGFPQRRPLTHRIATCSRDRFKFPRRAYLFCSGSNAGVAVASARARSGHADGKCSDPGIMPVFCPTEQTLFKCSKSDLAE